MKQTSSVNRHQSQQEDNILKELRKTVIRNAEYCRQELENVNKQKKNQGKLENSFPRRKLN